jgi:hypothetical protein
VAEQDRLAIDILCDELGCRMADGQVDIVLGVFLAKDGLQARQLRPGLNEVVARFGMIYRSVREVTSPLDV